MNVKLNVDCPAIVRLNKSQFEVLRYVMYDDPLPNPKGRSTGFLPKHEMAIKQLKAINIIREGRDMYYFCAKLPFAYKYNGNQYTVI